LLKTETLFCHKYCGGRGTVPSGYPTLERSCIIVVSYKKVEMWVMMACHFHSGIGSCEPRRFKYIEIIRQLLHKIHTHWR